MTFVNAGKNRVRDLLNTDLSHAELGTSSTASQASDTDLVAGDTDTSLAVTTSVADKQINIDYNLPSTTGNGESYQEFGIFNSSDTIFSRHVFAALTKSSTEQWQITTIYRLL
jgi:hypothetical protein